MVQGGYLQAKGRRYQWSSLKTLRFPAVTRSKTSRNHNGKYKGIHMPCTAAPGCKCEFEELILSRSQLLLQEINHRPTWIINVSDLAPRGSKLEIPISGSKKPKQAGVMGL